MNRREEKDIYRKAIRKWGFQLQLGMLMEECAELIQATHKVIRKGDEDLGTWRNLAQEMADVEIMIDQLKITVTWQDLQLNVKTNRHDKMLRLKEMLK